MEFATRLIRLWLMCCLSAAALLAASSSALAQPSGTRVGPTMEYRLKTAYLYNFLLYVKWPDKAFADAESPLVIGIFGDDPLGPALDDVARRKTAQGRRIVVRRFKSWDDYTPCHILFLPRTVNRATLAEAMRRTRDAPLLLVGETPGFATRGGAVNFYVDTDRTVGFEVNVDVTAQCKLRLDARLLKLAKIVKGPPHPGGTRPGDKRPGGNG